jgi:hypothetical protein
MCSKSANRSEASELKKKGYDKIAFGTDVIGDPALMARQNEEFTNRNRWFSKF